MMTFLTSFYGLYSTFQHNTFSQSVIVTLHYSTVVLQSSKMSAVVGRRALAIQNDDDSETLSTCC